MEHTFKIEKELKITTENIVDCVLCCEAGGFDYWGELCSDEKGYEAARQRIRQGEPCLLLLGTAWGLAPEVLAGADGVLPPISGRTGFNHLSVRSAAAILFDRLLGVPTGTV